MAVINIDSISLTVSFAEKHRRDVAGTSAFSACNALTLLWANNEHSDDVIMTPTRNLCRVMQVMF